MLSTLYSIYSLLVSFAVLCLGHGLQNTLIGVRASMENYSDINIGLMNSSYFIGFVLGTKFAETNTTKVGHIRTFAALASIISSLSLMHFLIINPYMWIFLRFVYGFCISGTFTVIESWLSALSSKENRGRIFSVYMILCFLMYSISQMFFKVSDGRDFILFAIGSIIFSFSLVPLILSKTQQPSIYAEEPLPLAKLFKVSLLATTGVLVTGMAAGAFWSMIYPCLYRIGFTADEIAKFISLSFMGGIIFQWPIGYFSDIFNRRIMICICCGVVGFLALAMAVISTRNSGLTPQFMLIAVLYGGFAFTAYSLFVSLANDFIKPELSVKTSAGLLALNGIGSIIGPILGALSMSLLGTKGLFLLMVPLYFSVSILGLFRQVFGKEIPEATTENFVPTPKYATAIYTLDPRYQEDPEEQ